MNTYFKIEEISAETKKQIIKKWKSALKTGWNTDLWKPCAMCHEIENRIDKWEITCHYCPLDEHEYCKPYTQDAQLHYNSCISEEEWRKNVKEFVEWVENSMVMDMA